LIIIRTERFKKAWQRLSLNEKSLAKKAILNLENDARYPSLNVKKVKGVDNIWEARVSLSIRITLAFKGNTIILRNIGSHDKTLGDP
jgi:mRNA interferase RelE/StbE